MTVASDGSIVVPPEVARRFGLVPGAAARIDIAPDGNTLSLRRPISSLAQVYVELTNGCNIDCRTCMRNVWSLQTGFMDDETFERLRVQIAEMPVTPTVFFGGFGEPMHHPKTTEYIRAMREIGAEVDLITNGTLLSEQRVDELIDAGLRRIWVSLDGARPESYSDVRLGASLPLVLRNLERLRHRKRLLSRTKPELGVAFVAMDRNIGDLPEVVRIGLDLGAEHFSVSNVLPHNQELNGQTLYDNEMARWNPRRADIDLARIDLNDPRVAEAIRGVLSAGSRTRGSVDLGFSPAGNRCPFVDKGSVSVRWDGSVSACLALLHTHTYYVGEHARTSHEHSFGSVTDQTLTEIWNSPEYVDFRRRLEEFSFSPCTTCRSCERIEENRDDCTNSGHPACGGCLWAQGFIRCP
ncbi:MAG: radical SAM protein [Spirochaeta sp.]|nr:radical SAM protein [Spirochaeta sp.]